MAVAVRPRPPSPTDPNWLAETQQATAVGSLAARGAGLLGADTAAAKNVLGDVGNITGIISGFEQGGVGGYLGAGANAAELTANLGAGSEIGGIAAEVAPPLVAADSIYNFANEWQSGKTGSDALAGAEAGASTGAAIGSIVPGVGTLIGGIAGAVIGGAVGALSSAFGGGATDPETKNWQSFIDATGGANATPAQVAKYQNMPPQSAFNLLAGVMDIRDGRIPIVNAFGRMGESNVMNGMFTQINAAYKAGQIKPGSTPQQIFNQVVTPWLNSKGATIGPETGGLQLQTVLTSLISSWQSGQLTSKTPLDSGGQADASLPAYEGLAARQSPVAQSVASNVTEQLLGFGGTPSSGLPPSVTFPILLGGHPRI